MSYLLQYCITIKIQEFYFNKPYNIINYSNIKIQYLDSKQNDKLFNCFYVGNKLLRK